MEQSKSQYLREYKQYKENLKFLGGPTVWTFEKTSKLNKQEVFETINGFNELISFLDSVLWAYEEGAHDWEEENATLQAKLDRYEAALKEIRGDGQKFIPAKHDILLLVNEALSTGEGKKDLK